MYTEHHVRAKKCAKKPRACELKRVYAQSFFNNHVSTGASLAENFYGLKRAPIEAASDDDNASGDSDGGASDAPTMTTLTPKQRGFSLFFLVLGPYIMRKIKTRLEQTQRRRQAENPDASETTMLDRLVSLYTYMSTVCVRM